MVGRRGEGYESVKGDGGVEVPSLSTKVNVIYYVQEGRVGGGWKQPLSSSFTIRNLTPESPPLPSR
jgi:hypothetical protein